MQVFPEAAAVWEGQYGVKSPKWMPAVLTYLLGRNIYRVIFKEALEKSRHIDQLRKRYERTPQLENASGRPLSQVKLARYQDKYLVTNKRARLLQQPLLPSPFTIMDTSSDLQTKYQKIASEYSKIRAQMAVLKTAVLEERSQNAELKDFVKSKDQGLRKAEQEMDSLNFRNQQLAKRVAFLQDELDAMQVKSKKGKSRGSSVNSHEAEQANHILDEEFRNKIEENARLLSLIQDKDMAHEQEVAALMQRLKRLEHEQQQQEQISQASEEKLKSMIERLEKENSRLLSKDNSLETLSGELNSPQLGKHLITNTTIQQDSPTRDTRKSELTAPSLNLKHQQQLHVEALTQVGHYVRDLTSALSDYHTYTEQRLHAVWDQLSPANIKFSSHLKENARHLRSLDQAYSEFLQGLEDSGDHSLHSETRPVLQSLVSQLANYSNYLQKLLPYQDLSRESCAVPKERRLKICANWMRSISSVWKLKELLSGARLKVCGVLGHVLETCYPLPLSPSFGSPTSRAHDIVVNYIMAGFSNTDTHCTLNTSLQEESLMVSSTESLRESNSAVSQYITGFTSHFVKLERCVKMLALQDECQPFLQRFQTSKPMTPYLFEAVEKLLRYLMNRCVKPDLMKCTGPKLLSIDTKKSENLILSKNIDIGFATKRLLGETAITVTERQKLEFIHECRSMLTTMIAKLQEKSPLKQKAVRGLSSLDPCVIQHSPQLAQKRFSFLLEELNHANIINDVLAENAKKEYLHFCNLKKSELQEIFRPCDQFSDEVGLDTIYGSFLIGEANYKHLWEVIKICLVLSHGNATVEGGFSVNKSLLVENMHEKTVIAQRHIHDEIQEAGGIKNIHISKKMLDYVRGARKRYHEYLEMKKQEKSEKDKKKAEKRKLDIQVKDLEGERKKLMMATEEKREAIDVELQELKKKQASLY
uniref:Protein phosphatase 1 regulatory subunit 21 n=1 Tax=Timema monikensis TaxID=170555 RepID=A0A7R9HMN4_9NEOP|nr:unnamed protein product [Timema monikensis]